MIISANSRYVRFKGRDEFLRIDLTAVVYFEAQGNYTRVVTENNLDAMVHLNLQDIDQKLLAGRKSCDKTFARVGKRYIVNTNHIFRISPLKKELVLSNQRTFIIELKVAKDALKTLIDLIAPYKKPAAAIPATDTPAVTPVAADPAAVEPDGPEAQ